MTEDKKWTMALGERQGTKDLPFHEKKGNPVEEIKEGMKVVQETKKVADELSGADKLKNELSEKTAALEKEREETHKKELVEINEKLNKALERGDNPVIKDLERRLEETKETYHKEQLENLRRDITELGKEKGKSTGDIAEDIRRIKEASKELGLGGTSQTPPEILLQLEEMRNNLQVRMEEMKDDRDRRDKEWQLTIKKWDEERELRREEATGKYAAEHERTEVIKSAIDRGARIIGRTVMEEEEATPSRPTSYHIEAEEAEMGEFTCPKCSSPVSIAPDTATAICAKCGFKAKVTRKAKSP